MELKEAIDLIRTPYLDSITPQSWADLGAGTGMFTKALAHLIGDNSTIYAVDKNIADLQQIQAPAQVVIKTLKADFINDPLHLTGLTGILMANSLHFVKDKFSFLDKIRESMSEGSAFLIVEYDTNKANQWVPYPIGFTMLKQLFEELGYDTIEKINDMPSRYNNNKIYSAWINAK
ncbi:class I SAM-dependent methyltransferase [Paraflavitalea speifideaquila]|uniref:class I SAM-dependent methyltransferase n=1 Tax=Paraflavitalea speifideaquila TaxID=3076558 RepID=UPI0028EC0F20|nr:class I SAM-dependent methyltransferase [Paraflavitalea speifideiaquila]